MGIEISAKNFARVATAKEHHNVTCSGGPALEVHMNPFDVDRCGWEDGDDVCGLTLVANGDIQPERLRILCAGDGVGVEETVTADVHDHVHV